MASFRFQSEQVLINSMPVSKPFQYDAQLTDNLCFANNTSYPDAEKIKEIAMKNNKINTDLLYVLYSDYC